jgi:hypothetical protein
MGAHDLARLQTRLARLKQALHSKGRLLLVIDDGMEYIEARIERCKAETQVTLADFIVIIKRFTWAPGWAPAAPWRVQADPSVGAASRPGPSSASDHGPKTSTPATGLLKHAKKDSLK